MITIKNRKLIIPKEDRVIGTVSDNNSETRIFVIDRYLANGIDLAALTFGMDMEYEDGTTKNATYLTKEVTDDFINLTWGIVAGDVQKAGTMFVQITAFDYDGTVKWATIRDAFYVEPVIGTAEQYTGSLSAFERMEAVLDQKLDKIEDYLDDIDDIEAAEEGRISAEEGRVSAESGRVLAEEGRVSAETLRDTAEGLRVSAETARALAETARANAETLRIAAEEARVSAEALRSTAEEGRISAENIRETNEVTRQNTLLQLQAAIEACENASTAQALKAEGYSSGTQNGTQVGPESVYWHNNAKWYMEQAQAIAVGSLGGLSDVELTNPQAGDGIRRNSQGIFENIPIYSKTELDALFANIYNKSQVYSQSEIDAMFTNYYTKTETNTALAGKADGLQLVGDRLSLMSGSTELDYVNITTGASSIVEIPVPKTKTYTYNGQVQTFLWDSIDSDHIALSGNTNTNAGSYTVTATLKNPADVWHEPDGTISKDPKPFAWTIAKAQGSFDLSVSSVSVDADDPTVSVNVTNIVGDGVISVTSDDPTVATAAYLNGVITITGLTTGSAKVTATMADSSNYDGTSDTISITAAFTVQVTLTVNGAKEDDIEIYEDGQTPGVDTPKATCTFATGQTSGTCLLTVPAKGGTFNFVSKKAKALDNSGNDYSKSINLTNSLQQTVNIMPDGEIRYWDGNMRTSFSVSGWQSAYSISIGDATLNTNDIYAYFTPTDDSYAAFDTQTIPTGYSKLKVIANVLTVDTLHGGYGCVTITNSKAISDISVIKFFDTLGEKTYEFDITGQAGKYFFIGAQNQNGTLKILAYWFE